MIHDKKLNYVNKKKDSYDMINYVNKKIHCF